MTETRTYTVLGMTCGHCTASVTEELREIRGIETVDVVLDTGTLIVTSSQPVDDAAIEQAVVEAGYALA